VCFNFQLKLSKDEQERPTGEWWQRITISNDLLCFLFTSLLRWGRHFRLSNIIPPIFLNILGYGDLRLILVVPQQASRKPRILLLGRKISLSPETVMPLEFEPHLIKHKRQVRITSVTMNLSRREWTSNQSKLLFNTKLQNFAVNLGRPGHAYYFRQEVTREQGDHTSLGWYFLKKKFFMQVVDLYLKEGIPDTKIIFFLHNKFGIPAYIPQKLGCLENHFLSYSKAFSIGLSV